MLTKFSSVCSVSLYLMYAVGPMVSIESIQLSELEAKQLEMIGPHLVQFRSGNIHFDGLRLPTQHKNGLKKLQVLIQRRIDAFKLCLESMEGLARQRCLSLQEYVNGLIDDRAQDDPMATTSRMTHLTDLNELETYLKTQVFYRNQLQRGGSWVMPLRQAIRVDYPLPLKVSHALSRAFNITKLYSHQADALKAIESGHHIVICTKTSSGKSLVFQCPILKTLESNAESTSLLIFPTKALAQDQKQSFARLLSEFNCNGIHVDTYDGDTPTGPTRRHIRDTSNIILTNPDMLHVSILPHHPQWKRFLSNLKFVIVDGIPLLL